MLLIITEIFYTLIHIRKMYKIIIDVTMKNFDFK